MQVIQIKTRKFKPPKDELADLLAYIPTLEDKSIVTITSKVLSICEGRCVPEASISHDEIIAQQSDSLIEPDKRWANQAVLTQKGDLILESGGVDLSNGNGFYILLPEHPFKSAKNIWEQLRKRDHIKHLGVVIADSHSVPRRRGAIGFALASYGFKASKDYKDEKDVFGHTFTFASVDVADSMAAAAVLTMGEGNEVTPIAVATGLNDIQFFNNRVPILTDRRYSWVHPAYDVYSPLLSSKLWRKTK